MALALRLLRPPCRNSIKLEMLLREQYINVYKLQRLRCSSSSARQDKQVQPVAKPPPPATSATEVPPSIPPMSSPTPAVNKTCAKTIPMQVCTPAPKQKLSSEAVRENVRGYMFTRFFDYLANYDKLLEKNFPSAMKVYRVFVDGVRDFYNDMKRYLRITRILKDSNKGLKALNRKELELYMQMPRDMVKVAPALIGSSLPMIGYAVLPLVFMFPERWLTAHFWSLQQRAEFQQIHMQKRLINNRAVFRLLQQNLHKVEKHPRYGEFKEILGLVGSGFHPNIECVIEVKDIFAHTPYDVYSLSGKHVKLLNALHGVPSGWFARHRLYEHAFLIHHMDLAIQREGGVHNMPIDSLRNSCFLRGLNPTNLTNDEMIEWMRQWIQVSTSITEDHISLFLHLPIFLGYNHPNNWQLIYDKKHKD